MKILHIVPSYIPAYRYGGPIASVHNLNKWLVKKGAEVTVYTTSVNGPEDLKVPVGVPVDVDGVKVFYFRPGFLRGWFCSPDMRRALKATAKDFDLIHVTSVFLSASALGAHYAEKAGVPYIISPRGSLMRFPLSISSLKKKAYINILEKRNLEGADAIHFTSEEEKSDYISFGFPFKKAIVLPNGIDTPESVEISAREADEFKAKHGIPAGTKVVLCLGRVSRIKGFDILIPAIAELKKSGPSAAFLVVGGDDDRGYLAEAKELVKKYNLTKEVIFAGMFSGRQKEIAFRAADLLVQASDSESFGMAAAEAMSYGLPVLLTKGVGLADLAREERAGLVVDKNIDEVAGGIKKLLEDEKLRLEMGENGRRAAEKYLLQEKVAEKFIGEYNSIIKEHEKRG